MRRFGMGHHSDVKTIRLVDTMNLLALEGGGGGGGAQQQGGITQQQLDHACEAAKTLRVAIAKEYAYVKKKVEDRAMGIDDDSDDEAPFDDDEEDDDFNYAQGPKKFDPAARAAQARAQADAQDHSSNITRSEFLRLGELKLVERIVVPTLLSHGLQHRGTVGWQYLKLLNAMTLPIPSGTSHIADQSDIFRSIRSACSTDEFFTFIVELVAPLVSRRALTSSLAGNDSGMVEVIVTLINNVLKDDPKRLEHLIGVLCRSHTIELLLVLLHQNDQIRNDIALKTEQIIHAKDVQQHQAEIAEAKAHVPEFHPSVSPVKQTPKRDSGSVPHSEASSKATLVSNAFTNMLSEVELQRLVDESKLNSDNEEFEVSISNVDATSDYNVPSGLRTQEDSLQPFRHGSTDTLRSMQYSVGGTLAPMDTPQGEPLRRLVLEGEEEDDVAPTVAVSVADTTSQAREGSPFILRQEQQATLAPAPLAGEDVLVVEGTVATEEDLRLQEAQLGLPLAQQEPAIVATPAATATTQESTAEEVALFATPVKQKIPTTSAAMKGPSPFADLGAAEHLSTPVAVKPEVLGTPTAQLTAAGGGGMIKKEEEDIDVEEEEEEEVYGDEDESSSSDDGDEFEEKDRGGAGGHGEEEDEEEDWKTRALRIAYENDLHKGTGSNNTVATLDLIERWNLLILESLSLVFRSLSHDQLALLTDASEDRIDRAIGQKTSRSFRQALTEDSKWRRQARLAPSATASSAVLVRRTNSLVVEQKRREVGSADIAIEANPALIPAADHQQAQQQQETDGFKLPPNRFVVTAADAFGTQQQDGVAVAQEVDKKKKARFIKNLLVHPTEISTMPLHTQRALATIYKTFLNHGFGSLSDMIWKEVRKKIVEVTEICSSGISRKKKQSDEDDVDGPMLDDFDGTDLGDVYNYINLAAKLCLFTRLVLRSYLQAVGDAKDLTGVEAAVAQEHISQLRSGLIRHWGGVVNLMTIDHFTMGYRLLMSVSCFKNLAAKYSPIPIAHYLTELFLLLVHMGRGDIVQDPAVMNAANGVAITIAKETSQIKALFGFITCVKPGGAPLPLVESALRLLHAVLFLLDHVCYNGILPDGTSLAAFYIQLSEPKYFQVLRFALKNHRLMSSDANLALAEIFHWTKEHRCEKFLYNIQFLILFSEILRSHQPHEILDLDPHERALYVFADRIVQDFFCPDAARKSHNVEDFEFEVALRIGRSLFTLSSVGHENLEEGRFWDDVGPGLGDAEDVVDFEDAPNAGAGVPGANDGPISLKTGKRKGTRRGKKNAAKAAAAAEGEDGGAPLDDDQAAVDDEDADEDMAFYLQAQAALERMADEESHKKKKKKHKDEKKKKKKKKPKSQGSNDEAEGDETPVADDDAEAKRLRKLEKKEKKRLKKLQRQQQQQEEGGDDAVPTTAHSDDALIGIHDHYGGEADVLTDQSLRYQREQSSAQRSGSNQQQLSSGGGEAGGDSTEYQYQYYYQLEDGTMVPADDDSVLPTAAVEEAPTATATDAMLSSPQPGATMDDASPDGAASRVQTNSSDPTLDVKTTSSGVVSETLVPSYDLPTADQPTALLSAGGGDVDDDDDRPMKKQRQEEEGTVVGAPAPPRRLLLDDEEDSRAE